MIDFFRRTVGKENVSEEKADLEVYATDSSRINGVTRLVVWPETAKQIHQIILFAKRANLSLVFRGAGTNLVGAVVPKNSVVVDMSKRNKILDIGKDFIVVEPGISVDEINKVLRDKFFPIVTEKSGVATIGGLISMNASCDRTMRFGKIENWVLETEIIDGTGRTRKTKDVIGREGMIGAIIKAKLKLSYKISETSLSVLKFNSSEELSEKVLKLKNNQNVLSLKFLNELAANLLGLEQKYYLFVEYLGTEGKVINKDEKKRILNKLDSLRLILGNNKFNYEEDVKIFTENLAEFLYWAKYKRIPCFGNLGHDVIHPFLKSREDAKSLYDIVLKLKGELIGEYGVGYLKKEVASSKFKEEIIKLKTSYDPSGILNMGKLIRKEDIIKEDKFIRKRKQNAFRKM